MLADLNTPGTCLFTSHNLVANLFYSNKVLLSTNNASQHNAKLNRENIKNPDDTLHLTLIAL